jgi:hypothetical protein
MEADFILSALREHHQSLQKAIAALQALSPKPKRGRPPKSAQAVPVRKRRNFSTATRKRMSQAQKKRWAEAKRKAKKK